MRGTGPRVAASLAAALALAAVPGTARPAAADPPRWRLAPGALAEYSLFPVTVKSGERKQGDPRPFGVFGHRVVEGRSPRPLYPELGSLASIYALTLPPEAAGGKETAIFASLTNCGPVEVSGRWTVAAREDGKVASSGTFDLRHRGPPKSDDFDRVLVDGSLAVSSVFDPARGVVEEASYDLRARTAPDEGKDRKVSETRRIADLVLRRVRDARDASFQPEVDAAIAKGVAWLQKQPTGGNWPLYPDYPGGSDGIAALALSACDEERKAGDEALRSAMGFEPTKTYQAAVTMMAIDMKRTPPGEADLLRSGKIDRPVRHLAPREREWMEKGARFLRETALGPGKWNYPSAQHGGRFVPPPPDLSNSQYGVLGLQAAHRCGVPVEEGTWLGILRAFLQAQEREGRPTATGAAAPRGWAYRVGDPASGSMTCAGIATVAIARGLLREGGGKRLPPDLAADAGRAVADGFAWLGSRWTVEEAPHADGRPRKWLHYHLYALERAGILAGAAKVEGHDWYGDGALHLLLTQDAEGWWTEETGSLPRKIADTGFALLFLKRAVTPVEK